MKNTDKSFKAILEEYMRTKADDPSVGTALQELLNVLNEKKQDFLLSDLRRGKGNEKVSTRFIDVVRHTKSRTKGNIAKALMLFAKYLEYAHSVHLDLTNFPQDIPEALDRRIDMLKFMQTKCTREELEHRYLVGKRTIDSDLTALETGWKLLGNTIKINTKPECETISYDSTVHPLLLPLNLSEVYTLTVGLKQMSKGGPFESMADYIASTICSRECMAIEFG